MNKEKFKIIQFIKELIIAVDNSMDNFPKKDLELKNKIRMNTYDLLEIAYEANATDDIVYKRKMLIKSISKIKVIDFLLNLIYDKKIINYKKYLHFAAKLDDIAKYTNGWLKTIK